MRMQTLAAVAALLYAVPAAAEDMPDIGVKFFNSSLRTVVAVRFHHTMHPQDRPLRVRPRVAPGADLYQQVPNLPECIYHIDFVFEDGTTSELFRNYNICQARPVRLHPVAPQHITKVV